MWGVRGGKILERIERPKTSKGQALPAASRLDRLMNFFTEFFRHEPSVYPSKETTALKPTRTTHSSFFSRCAIAASTSIS